MSQQNTRKYKATFILDLRDSEDDSKQLLSEITDILGTINGSVSDEQDLGLRDFVRSTDRRYTQGHYVEISFIGAKNTPADLKEKLRLDKRVNRIFIESI